MLADGLAVGDGAAEQRGGTTEWDLEPVEVSAQLHDEWDEPELIDELERSVDPRSDAEEVSPLDQRISLEPNPEPEESMVIERARKLFNGEAKPLELVERSGEDAATRAPGDEPDGERPPSPVLRLIEQTRAERAAHHDRVAGLFPAPETTEWSVREIAYDRTRRARVDDQVEIS